MPRSRPPYPPEFREQRLAGDLYDSRSEVAGNSIVAERAVKAGIQKPLVRRLATRREPMDYGDESTASHWRATLRNASARRICSFVCSDPGPSPVP